MIFIYARTTEIALPFPGGNLLSFFYFSAVAVMQCNGGNQTAEYWLGTTIPGECATYEARFVLFAYKTAVIQLRAGTLFPGDYCEVRRFC